MGIRIVLFFLAVFLGFVGLMKAIHFPVDGILTFLFVLMPIVVGLFAHYRRIGRLRTLGLFDRALWHLRFWRILLPREAYIQLRLSILVEGGERDTVLKAIEEADGIIAAPFLFGFCAEMERRNGAFKEAEVQLKLALEDTPPGILRTGILAQLSRLYAVFFPTHKKLLKEAEAMLDEAQEYVSEDVHVHLIEAIRGELAYAQKHPTQAVQLLESNLELLMDSPSGIVGEDASFLQRVGAAFQSLFAQLTYSQQDEHQFPLYAELYVSLGHAWKALKQREKARAAYQKGASLCKQPFISERIEEAIEALER